LRDGQPGAALLAMETGVPLYPLAQWGLTDLADNIKKLKKTDVHIRVGEPFRVRMPAEGRPTRDALREATSQMMYRIAALLPETHRGKFQDPESAPRTHLEEPS
jgi:1-acyl-sn-glycerol-3-phosphate acyltransferase